MFTFKKFGKFKAIIIISLFHNIKMMLFSLLIYIIKSDFETEPLDIPISIPVESLIKTGTNNCDTSSPCPEKNYATGACGTRCWSNSCDYQYTFKGVKCQVYGTYDSSHGKFEIYIDEKLHETVDQERSSRSTFSLQFTSKLLPYGEHTIKLHSISQMYEISKIAYWPSMRAKRINFTEFTKIDNGNEWETETDKTGGLRQHATNKGKYKTMEFSKIWIYGTKCSWHDRMKVEYGPVTETFSVKITTDRVDSVLVYESEAPFAFYDLKLRTVGLAMFAFIYIIDEPIPKPLDIPISVSTLSISRTNTACSNTTTCPDSITNYPCGQNCWSDQKRAATHSYTFTGVRFQIYGTFDPNHRAYRVYCDDILLGTVNQKTTSRYMYKVQYTSGIFPYTQHTVRLVGDAQNDFEIYKIAYWPSLRAKRINISDFNKEGEWKTETDNVGGVRQYSNGGSCKVQIQTNKFWLIGTKTSWHGQANVKFGNWSGSFSEHDSGSRQDYLVVYESPEIEFISDELIITTSNGAVMLNCIYYLFEQPPKDIPVSIDPQSMIVDGPKQCSETVNCPDNTIPDYPCGNKCWSTDNNKVSYEYTFIGVKFQVFGTNAENHRNFSLYIDGEIEATISEKYGTGGNRQNYWLLYTSGPLPYGQHTIKVAGVGFLYEISKFAYWVDLNAVRINASDFQLANTWNKQKDSIGGFRLQTTEAGKELKNRIHCSKFWIIGTGSTASLKVSFSGELDETKTLMNDGIAFALIYESPQLSKYYDDDLTLVTQSGGAVINCIYKDIPPPPTVVFTNSEFFTESKKFSKSDQFSVSQKFSYSKDFTKSEDFSKSKDFTESNDFTESKTFPTEDFTKSDVFSSTVDFTKSDKFSSTLDFTRSEKFSSSNKFSNSKYFSQSNKFSSSSEFTLTNDFSNSEKFSKSLEFPPSNVFSDSFKFTNSKPFSKTGEFSETVQFSKSHLFSLSEKFSKSEEFSKSQLFSSTNKFSKSEDFSKSQEFTKTGEFSLTGQFTQSNQFSTSGIFSKSNEFTNSQPFSSTNKFSSSALFSETSAFSKTGEFSTSGQFTQSNQFSTSSMFSKSNEFTNSQPFSSTNKFSSSALFSETSAFSKTGEFSTSGQFTQSNQFSTSSMFSKSGEFSKTEIFSLSTKFSVSGIFSYSQDFSDSAKFTNSKEFSESSYFSSSVGFTKTLEFSESISFTESGKFSSSNYFSQSKSFSISSKFSGSNEFSETHHFSLTNKFSLSSAFSFTQDFSTSEKFSISGKFSLSQYFSKTDHFSFSDKFSLTISFTTSEKFSKSGLFTLSQHFSATKDFSNTKGFTKTTLFSTSEKFTKSKGFSDSKQFSQTEAFSYSMQFTESQFFSPSMTPEIIDPPCGYWENGNFTTLEECLFNASDGKMIYIYVLSTNFTGYKEGNGTAIHIVNCGIHCNDTKYIDCVTTTGCGGAIYIKNTQENVNNATFIDLLFLRCKANFGGAVFIHTTSDQFNISFIGCNFTSNEAFYKKSSNNKNTMFYGGGAIFLMSKGSSCVNCSFSHNKGSAVKIYNNFDNNDLRMLSSSDYSPIEFIGCDFEKDENSKSSINFVDEKNGNNIQLKDCIFRGKLKKGSHYIEGKWPIKDKLKIISCKFENDFMNSAVNMNSLNDDEILVDLEKRSNCINNFIIIISLIALFSAIFTLTVKRLRNSTHDLKDDSIESFVDF